MTTYRRTLTRRRREAVVRAAVIANRKAQRDYKRTHPTIEEL